MFPLVFPRAIRKVASASRGTAGARMSRISIVEDERSNAEDLAQTVLSPGDEIMRSEEWVLREPRCVDKLRSGVAGQLR